MRLQRVCWLIALIATLVALQGYQRVIAAPPSPTIGKIAFVSWRGDNPSIYIMDADGKNQHRLIDMGAQQPAWSWDGTQIAFSAQVDEVWQIFIATTDGTHVRQISHDPFDSAWPAFSPDGKYIVYESFQPDTPGLIYEMNADGRNPHPLNDYGMGSECPKYSPDGKSIAYLFWAGSWSMDSVMDRSGDFIFEANHSTRYDVTQYFNPASCPSWSPDGKFIAMGTNVTPNSMAGLFIAPSGTRDIQMVGNYVSGFSPTWSPDGTNLAFVDEDSEINLDIYVVDIMGNNRQKLTQGGNNQQPAWQPQPIF